MSSPSPSISPEPPNAVIGLSPASLPVHSATVAVHLTLHISVPAQTMKGKPKAKKEQKMKELTHSFAPTSDNYVEFLKAILAKHGEEKYNVTVKRRYSFKALTPPSKVCVYLVPNELC